MRTFKMAIKYILFHSSVAVCSGNILPISLDHNWAIYGRVNLLVSSIRTRLKLWNLAFILPFLTFETYKKSSFSRQITGSFEKRPSQCNWYWLSWPISILQCNVWTADLMKTLIANLTVGKWKRGCQQYDDTTQIFLAYLIFTIEERQPFRASLSQSNWFNEGNARDLELLRCRTVLTCTLTEFSQRKMWLSGTWNLKLVYVDIKLHLTMHH